MRTNKACIAVKFELEVNDSAVQVFCDETPCDIARELAAAVRRSVTIGWTLRQHVRARLPVLVKRVLRQRRVLMGLLREFAQNGC